MHVTCTWEPLQLQCTLVSNLFNSSVFKYPSPFRSNFLNKESKSNWLGLFSRLIIVQKLLNDIDPTNKQ